MLMDSSIAYGLGIGSGIDILNLAKSLAEAERAPKEALIKKREEANSARLSALAEAAHGIDAFAGALSSLVGSGALFTQPSVSDPSILRASAVAGSRLTSLSAQIEVIQLAKAQTLQTAVLPVDGAAGQGELTLTVGSATHAIVIGPGNDSLSGLAKAINDLDSGVVASVIADQGGARLVLKGQTGEANAFSLSVPDGTSSGLERFAYGPSVTGGMSIAQAAQDAVVRLDGVEIRRASNSFKDVIEGVQIDLQRAVPGTTVSMGVSRPTASIEQALSDFVLAFNELATMLATSTSAGAAGGAAGPLRGDVGVAQLRRELAGLPSKVLSSTGPIRTLAEIGVATNRDGTLSLNTTRLQEVLASDPVGVEALFNPTQSSSSPLVVIGSAMGKVKPGTYTLTDLVPASGGVDASGKIDGAAANAVGSFLIAPYTSAALGLVFEVKGAVASATITVDPGLAGALQAIRDSIRARSGPIAKSEERITQSARELAEERAKIETRSATYYNQLLASFTAMERNVSAFRATQSYLEQQVKVWTNSND